MRTFLMLFAAIVSVFSGQGAIHSRTVPRHGPRLRF